MLKKIILIAVILGAIGAGYGYYLYQKEVPGLQEVEADYSLNAPELFSAFDASESEAMEKYSGKVVSVSGTVNSVDKKGAVVNVVLASDSDFGAVLCKLDSNYADVNIQPNQEITLKCQCNGYLMDVVMNRCVIEK